MQFAFQVGAYVLGLPLELMVIAVLLRGPYRRYPLVLFYVVVDFLTTVIEIQPGLAYRDASPAAKRTYALIYWWDERIIQVIVFLLVISLVYRATEQWRPRRTLLVSITAGTLVVAAITFLIHFDPKLSLGRWMTPWTRDMNFCAAILDLGLWAILIGSRKKDYRLLMVSGALGMQFTAGAIGQALRGLSDSMVIPSGDFIIVGNLTCLYIWWQAFRAPDKIASESQRDNKIRSADLPGSSPK
jgi:hypothetical protein